MQIQFNTDNTIEGREELAERVETELRRALGRFETHVTRLEVHLSDVNGARAAGDDKRCTIEARLAGRDPEAVSHQAPTIDAAVDGAVKKLRRVLDGALGRMSDHKGAPSIRTGP